MAGKDIAKIVAFIAIVLFVFTNKSLELFANIRFLLFENLLLVMVAVIIFLIWRNKQ